MALFRKLTNGKLARTFDPSNKGNKKTPDRVIEDMESFKEKVIQTSNRIEAIKQTPISQELKEKFIAAEYAKLGYTIDLITSSK